MPGVIRLQNGPDGPETPLPDYPRNGHRQVGRHVRSLPTTVIGKGGETATMRRVETYSLQSRITGHSRVVQNSCTHNEHRAR
jgi:hypothetical protein